MLIMFFFHRRMFPSVRVNLSGLEEDASYCLMLEMVPIGDCRYKFSGSQWVPAGGAEPQSPQRMYLHPDSPALGSHWNSQPISFSKVKLTNNTLDSSGHVSISTTIHFRLFVCNPAQPLRNPFGASRICLSLSGSIMRLTDDVRETAAENN